MTLDQIRAKIDFERKALTDLKSKLQSPPFRHQCDVAFEDLILAEASASSGELLRSIVLLELAVRRRKRIEDAFTTFGLDAENLDENESSKTFGNWSYDSLEDSITFLPNGYRLHRGQPHKTADFWLNQLKGESWYGAPQDCADLLEAFKHAGWQ